MNTKLRVHEKELTAEFLNKLFIYREGQLVRKIQRGSAMAGEVVGYKKASGYLTVIVDDKTYLLHRLIWIMHHGTCPEFLDHINGVKDDNTIENLRPATRYQNAQNRGAPKNNTSGKKGVCWHKGDKKWQAGIKANGKWMYLGSYDSLEEAAKAYDDMAVILHGEYKREVDGE